MRSAIAAQHMFVAHAASVADALGNSRIWVATLRPPPLHPMLAAFAQQSGESIGSAAGSVSNPSPQ